MATSIRSQTQADEAGQPSLASLLGRLAGDASALFRGEVALAKAELTAAATNIKLGAVAAGVALIVLLVGAMALVAAAILGLSLAIAPWLAALLVGGALSAIGAVMLQIAKRKIQATTPPMPRTEASLKRDADIIARKF